MLRTLLRLNIAITIIFTLSTLALRTVYGLFTPSPQPFNLLKHPTCETLCWKGITPGTIPDGYEGVIDAILYSRLPISGMTVAHQNKDVVELSFSHYIEARQPDSVYIKINVTENRLTQISVAPDTLCFSQVAAELGLPDAYYIAHSGETFILVYRPERLYMAFRVHQPHRAAFVSLYDGDLPFSTQRYHSGTWRDVAPYLRRNCV